MVTLNENNFDTKKNVSQSYDGGSNMQGSIKGMKKLVQKECLMAIFTWCYVHRFNLVIEKAV